jgi:trimeric autotransporter adhesin
MPSRLKNLTERVLFGFMKYLSGTALSFLFLFFAFTAYAGSGEKQKQNDQVSNSPFTLSLVVSDFNGFGVSCNGSSDGAVDMTINGGTAPFVIQWSNGSSSEDLSGVPAGTYTVTVTDGDLDVQTETVVITEPSAINLSIDQVNDVSCFGLTDGGISISASGGTGTLDYLWSDASTSEDLSGVGANTYTVTVTDDNGCTASASDVISQPAQLVVAIDQVNDVSCFGLTDGGISISASGGTGTLDYLWSDASTSEDLSGVGANTYTYCHR